MFNNIIVHHMFDYTSTYVGHTYVISVTVTGYQES